MLFSQGQTIAQARKSMEVSEQTYYRWRREYWGMDTTQAKKLKELEKENSRLKKLVADLSSHDPEPVLSEVEGARLNDFIAR